MIRFFRALPILFALLPAAARADQTDKRLDALFAALKSAPSAEQAQPVEARIWDIWMQSGDPRVDALMRDGMLALETDDRPAALEAFSRVVALAPNFAEGWNKRATVLFLLGRPEDSIRDIAKVLALEPRHFGALAGLGLCNAQLDRDEAALAAFERAAAIDPQAEGIRRNIADTRKRLQGKAI